MGPAAATFRGRVEVYRKVAFPSTIHRFFMQTELEKSIIAPSSTQAAKSFGVVTGKRDERRELELLEIARQFLAAIETDTTQPAEGFVSGASAYYASDVLQEEFPNRFLPAGAQRDLAALGEAAKRGRGVLRSQRFEPRTAQATGDVVILEVLWVGTLAVSVGNLSPGDEMRAHFAVFLEFRDEKIVRHRTYDCFEPF